MYQNFSFPFMNMTLLVFLVLIITIFPTLIEEHIRYSLNQTCTYEHKYEFYLLTVDHSSTLFRIISGICKINYRYYSYFLDLNKPLTITIKHWCTTYPAMLVMNDLKWCGLWSSTTYFVDFEGPKRPEYNRRHGIG